MKGIFMVYDYITVNLPPKVDRKYYSIVKVPFPPLVNGT